MLRYFSSSNVLGICPRPANSDGDGHGYSIGSKGTAGFERYELGGRVVGAGVEEELVRGEIVNRGCVARVSPGHGHGSAASIGSSGCRDSKFNIGESKRCKGYEAQEEGAGRTHG